ncbi:unnamed protein product [Porites lobata]|uniref:DJ-1/PfpI domain-containing protein n=1 Tax=Porites lobata TaxID=104759 RepID=A0ABN8S3C0_9CNID|nr:unnamed protein product [Porites lobata]
MADLKGSALVILAEGAEEMEAVITTDVLRRGKVKTVVGGLAGGDAVTCSRYVVVIKPDMNLSNHTRMSGPYDAVILPGGLGGSNNLAKLKRSILQEQEQSGRIIGAICAAPTALHTHGIAKEKIVTSHPSVKDKLDQGYLIIPSCIVRDGNLVTSRGPGTAFEFGIELVHAVRGDDGEAEKLAGPMLIK